MPSFTIKQNDTKPPIEAKLQRDGETIDLTGASVKFHMKAENTLKVDASASIENASEGLVKYQWQTGDTDKYGGFLGEFQVTYSDGKIETFPNDSYFNIWIFKELG